jgi:hypothetical protein
MIIELLHKLNINTWDDILILIMGTFFVYHAILFRIRIEIFAIKSRRKKEKKRHV